MQIFPNPFVNSFSVLLHNSDAQSVSLKLYDAGGRLFYNQKSNINNSLFTTINTAALSKGIYFFEIEGNDGSKMVKKIMKQ